LAAVHREEMSGHIIAPAEELDRVGDVPGVALPLEQRLRDNLVALLLAVIFGE
jgi:hypothetical protein